MDTRLPPELATPAQRHRAKLTSLANNADGLFAFSVDDSAALDWALERIAHLNSEVRRLRALRRRP